MKILKILFIHLFIIHSLYGQNTVYRDTIPVFEANKSLTMPWAGGINFASFSQIDLNFDGKLDIMTFDKICSSGGKLKAYLNIGTAGISKYQYAPNYQFPFVESWTFFVDYDRDGQADLFTYTNGGIKVFKNNSTPSNLKFDLMSSLLLSDYGNVGAPSIANIYSSSVGMPVFSDIDNDGDIDVLAFFGTTLEYHKNMSQELYKHSDSLVFKMVDGCWGNIIESNCELSLNQCPARLMNELTIQQRINKTLHAGSCIMCFDRNGDGDKDLLMGDISCDIVLFAENDGTPLKAHIGDTTKLFPNYPNKASAIQIKLNSFPCTYYLDVDNDGYKDLVASPNAISGSENFESVWYYKNTSTTPTVNFVFQKKNFLQEDMIDLGEGAYPVLFDADSDGKKDLIVGNLGYYATNTNKSKLAYYKNIGTQASPSFSLITRDYQNLSSFGLYSMAPTFGDLDGDGDLDLMIGDYGGNVNYFENTAPKGSPAQFNKIIKKFSSIDVGNIAFPQLYDVNKNGTLDLIIGSLNGRLAYYSNVGTPTNAQFDSDPTGLLFGSVDVRQTSPYQSSTGYSMPFMFNEGGKTKLIVGSEIGRMYLYDNIDGNLAGKFNRVDTNFFLINEGPRCAPFYEDITNDGKRDLFVGNHAGGLSFFNSTKIIGIEDLFKDDNVKIYPNPASEEITISINDNNFSEIQVTCLDVFAKTILEFSTFNKNISINISKFNKGVYFLQLKNKENNQHKQITKKLIVQ